MLMYIPPIYSQLWAPCHYYTRRRHHPSYSYSKPLTGGVVALLVLEQLTLKYNA